MFLIEEQHVLTSQPYYFIYHNVNMQICVSVPKVIMYYLIITNIINLHVVNLWPVYHDIFLLNTWKCGLISNLVHYAHVISISDACDVPPMKKSKTNNQRSLVPSAVPDHSHDSLWHCITSGFFRRFESDSEVHDFI